MPSRVTLLLSLAVAAALAPPPPTAPAASPPADLPRYDLGIVLDPQGCRVGVRQLVAWTNPGPEPIRELVFNLHAHARPPLVEKLRLAKVLEMVRVAPSEALVCGPICDVRQAQECGPDGVPVHPLSWSFRADNDAALVVELPEPVAPGQEVRVLLELEYRLPEKQGRWGRWQGVTTLTGWLPTLAAREGGEWQPVPFVPWYQPNCNPAAFYRARVRVPAGQKVACTCPLEGARDVGDGWTELDLGWCPARDFALLASDRWAELTEPAGPVRLRCLAFPEHADAARQMLRTAATSLEAFRAEFGPGPMPELTLAESYLGWLGESCSGVLVIDERFFTLPGIASDCREFMVTRLVCQQWWTGGVGVDGFHEPFMELGVANGLAHRLLDGRYGKNNSLVRYPSWLRWMPSIGREDLRMTLLSSAIARHEGGPPVQPLPKFGHLANLSAVAGDRGGKIVGLIEARLEGRMGEFLRRLYCKYEYRTLRVKDLQAELEQFTGEPWEEFFRNWLYGSGTTDWCVESVTVRPLTPGLPRPTGHFLDALRPTPPGPCHVTVIVRQKGDFSEPTVVGFAFDDEEAYRLRLPLLPGCGSVTFADPAARVVEMTEGRVRFEVDLPEPPTQVAVDPDGVLLDRDPADNYWKPRVHWKLTPLYTFLDETEFTCAYDRWNVIAGPWYFDPNYGDPWFTRATLIGARVGAYRTEQFEGGVYAGWRPDYRDVAAGFDATLSHWPWAKAELGLNVEHSLFEIGPGGTRLNRAVLYARHIFDETDSLYLPPMHYVEGFAAHQNNFLPPPRPPGVPEPDPGLLGLGSPTGGINGGAIWHQHWLPPGAVRFHNLSQLGVHYHLDLLTPYWDPEMGFKCDLTTAAGLPILGQPEATYQATGQLSAVTKLPDGLGWLSETRIAVRGYGALGLPSNVLLYSLGGDLLFRGFDLAQRQGSSMWVGSVEWRVPLWKRMEWDWCDHLCGVRGVGLAPFYDVGNAYLNCKPTGPLAHAIGLGLRVDMAWASFLERTTLRFDFAKALNDRTPLQFWFGIQHPF